MLDYLIYNEGVIYNQIYEPYSFLCSVKMGYLGPGLPFALGAKVADSERKVYCITGDGAVGFNIMEMETALREDIPIVVVAAVDEGWGMERSTYTFQGCPPEMHQGIGLSGNLRYDLIAQGLGCYGEKVDELGQFVPALERAVESGKPALLHVTIDPDINADPPGYQEFRYARTL